MTISSQEDSGAALLYDLDDQSIVLHCKWRVLLCEKGEVRHHYDKGFIFK